MDKMYTTEQAAKELGLKVRTVRHYIVKGKIKAIKYNDIKQGNWFIPESEIKRLKGEQ